MVYGTDLDDRVIILPHRILELFIPRAYKPNRKLNARLVPRWRHSPGSPRVNIVIIGLIPDCPFKGFRSLEFRPILIEVFHFLGWGS
jgi:hypothetical protein